MEAQIAEPVVLRLFLNSIVICKSQPLTTNT